MGGWDDCVDKARQEISSELLAQNLEIAVKANEGVLDRIDKGDHKLTKEGIVRVPMDGKSLAVVGGIAQDKGRTGMGLAVSYSGRDQSMDAMRLEFARMSASHDKLKSQAAILEASVIDEQ